MIGSREGRGPRRWQRLCVADAGGFYDGVDGVGGDVLQRFDFATGPADLHRVDFCGFAEAEVEAEIVLGEIASAAADFGDLADATGVDGDASADGGAIAFCAD